MGDLGRPSRRVREVRVGRRGACSAWLPDARTPRCSSTRRAAASTVICSTRPARSGARRGRVVRFERAGLDLAGRRRRASRAARSRRAARLVAETTPARSTAPTTTSRRGRGTVRRPRLVRAGWSPSWAQEDRGPRLSPWRSPRRSAPTRPTAVRSRSSMPALDASLALLHDTGDVVPGVQELVELHRTARPDNGQVRGCLWAQSGRGYDLLPGLRRHRDWTALRPRAMEATVASLRRTYAIVVADTDADLEGEAETGSLDVEERNACSRLLRVGRRRRGDHVDARARSIHRLVRTLAELLAFGVDPSRLLPVVLSCAAIPSAPSGDLPISRPAAGRARTRSRHREPAHGGDPPRAARGAARRGTASPRLRRTDRRRRRGRARLASPNHSPTTTPSPLRSNPGASGQEAWT